MTDMNTPKLTRGMCGKIKCTGFWLFLDWGIIVEGLDVWGCFGLVCTLVICCVGLEIGRRGEKGSKAKLISITFAIDLKQAIDEN